MARNFVIYDSRNRLTGTQCVTLDLRHADATPAVVKAAGGKRYAAMCVEHKSTVFFDEHYPAGRAIAHVDEWCKPCQAMIAKGDKLAKPAKVEATVVAPTPVQAAGSGKRTSNAKSNVATQRKSAATRKPSAVTTTRKPRTSRKATAAA